MTEKWKGCHKKTKWMKFWGKKPNNWNTKILWTQKKTRREEPRLKHAATKVSEWIPS